MRSLRKIIVRDSHRSPRKYGRACSFYCMLYAERGKRSQDCMSMIMLKLLLRVDAVADVDDDIAVAVR